MRFKKSVSLLVVLSVSFLSAITVFAEGESTPRFALTPASDSKDGKMVFMDIEGGESVEGLMQLTMMDNVSGLFKLDSSLMNNALGSKEVFGDVSDWIEFPEYGDPIYLKGKESVKIPVKITVPVGTLPGDYRILASAAMISYGDALESSIAASQGSDGAFSIGAKVMFASGVQIFIRVAGEIETNLILNDLKYEFLDDGSVNIALTCQNDSLVTVVPVVTLTITDTIKKLVPYKGTFDLQPSQPKTGCGGPFVVRLDNSSPLSLPDGIYEFDMSLDYVVLDYFKQRSEMEVFHAARAYFKAYKLPIKLYFTCVGILIVLLLFITFKIYSFKRLKSISKLYTVQPNETLDSIAAKFSVNPKYIVKVNRLKFPFTLVPRSKILIPKKTK